MKLYSKILGYVLLLCYCFFAGGFGNIVQHSSSPAACTVAGKKSFSDGTTSISGKTDPVQWSLKIKYTGGEPCFLPACCCVAPGRTLFFSNDDISSRTDPRTASAGLVTLTLRGPPAALPA